MKIRLRLALVGLAISFALPTFAQQKDTAASQIDEQIVKKFDEAFNNGDAAAVAALYTEDAILVPDTGPVYGREAIEKYWAGLFKKFHVSNQADKAAPDSPHTIGTAGNEAWSHGQWKVTLQGQDGKPFDLTGNWTEIYRREGDTWKRQLDTFSTTPAPAATPTPSNQ
jgi:ketosteroid isomerase-like protein